MRAYRTLPSRPLAVALLPLLLLAAAGCSAVAPYVGRDMFLAQTLFDHPYPASLEQTFALATTEAARRYGPGHGALVDGIGTWTRAPGTATVNGTTVQTAGLRLRVFVRRGEVRVEARRWRPQDDLSGPDWAENRDHDLQLAILRALDPQAAARIASDADAAARLAGKQAGAR